MSTLINNATIKVRRDTASSWITNNPTPNQGEWCLETDTGNIKIGDGSTAWTSLAYYIPASLANTYDLTSENKTHTLPEITGAPQIVSIYWKNGGTYKLTLAVTDGATVGGETASTWEGEGEGHILLESDGSNWQVREYGDSGSNSNGNWKKEKDGSLIQNITSHNVGANDGITTTLPMSFYNTSYSVVTNLVSSTPVESSYYIHIKEKTTTTFTIYRSDSTARTHNTLCYGRWKA